VYFRKSIRRVSYGCIDRIACTVYPETKGVPLEEMDAVFGEGESRIFFR